MKYSPKKSNRTIQRRNFKKMLMKNAIAAYKKENDWNIKTREATSVMVKYKNRNNKELNYLVELYSEDKEYELSALWETDHDDVNADIDGVVSIFVYGRIV